MARQSIYDDPEFFTGYQTLRARSGGLNDEIEIPAVRSLLPELGGRTVVDLGCGSGHSTVWYAQQGAHVLGIDPSKRMLDEAEPHPLVQYRQCFAEDLELEPDSVDVVVASMSLHYVADLGVMLQRIATWLRPGGCVVASMEHPVMTAVAAQQWCETGDHWPVDSYHDEGPRQTRWFVDGVIKYHRTLSTTVEAFLNAGLRLDSLQEPTVNDLGLARRPDLIATRRRPPILLILAGKPLHPETLVPSDRG